MNALTQKFREVVYSVLPITVIVLILNMTLTPMEPGVVVRFAIGAVFIMVGLSIFLFGVDLGITPIGTLMGSVLTKKNKLWFVVVGGLVLGFLVSIAEPDLHILAEQVANVTSNMLDKWVMVAVVSAGIAVMLSAGLLRIVKNFPLYKMLLIIYGVILIMSFFVSSEFLAISFDASGATTGALTVPFILAIAMGVSGMKKDSKASEKDSFGLVGVASTGAIISVLVVGMLFRNRPIAGSLEIDITGGGSAIWAPFLQHFPHTLLESVVALLPLLLIFVAVQFTAQRVSKRAFRRTVLGMVYTLIGLVIFLVGVNAGFMDVGTIVGYQLASMDNKLFVILIGFLLGLVVILAEPAVYVLTHQIQDVTSGYVKRSTVLIALAIGVGLAVGLSMVRIVFPAVQLWHYLLPGYIISIALSFVVPKLFVGIAFDSGGVASGPMTATFILAFAQGAAEAMPGADVLVDGFGMIAMVALMPIIALQVLGWVYKIKSAKKGALIKNG